MVERWKVAGAGVGLAAAALVAGPYAAAAQDLEVASFVAGRPLPAAYFDRVSRNPRFFEVQRGWIARAAMARARGGAVEGNLPILVVLSLFSDSPIPSVSPSEIQRIVFDGPSEPGTLTEFYAEQSRGRLNVTGEVVEWVRTDLSVSQVRAGSFGLGSDARTGEFLAQAMAQADETVDFGAFDNDGPDGLPNSGDDDGFVDALAIEFLEAAITCQGQGPTIWAHRSRLSRWNGEPYATNDTTPQGLAVLADDYITQAAVRCDGREQNVIVIAHEFGHALGLPDLYDATEGIQPAQRNWVVGCWSIMAAGQWGCEPALSQGTYDRPPHFGPWEKEQLGWLPDIIHAGSVLDEEFVLRPVESTGDVLRVDLSAQEYLLIEYRDGSGFDRNLPATGVLVHHVDETRTTGNRRCRTCPQIYQAALIEADANRSLIKPEEQGGSRGEPGDIFARSGVGRLTNTTTPSTRLNSGAPSDVSLYSIRVDDGVARIGLSTRVIEFERLLDRFLQGGAGDPTAQELAYLDDLGNRNDRYDVADLRAYLLEHPSVVARLGGDGR